ncbi:MAG: peptidylprolyl isomerase [Flavobacteriales bacterium]
MHKQRFGTQDNLPTFVKNFFMSIQENTVVSLSYKLMVKSDNDLSKQVVEETTSENLFTFLFGAGNVIPAFEANLSGLQAGDSFSFEIKASEGYGLASNDNIAAIPIRAFVPEGEELDSEMVSPGNFLPMVDENGHQFQGLVVEVNADHVIMDFNHPLAGKNLHFSGKVEKIRNATPDELAHGHVHGEGGVHH